MTANELQYWRNVETYRHNIATEQQALLDAAITSYDVYQNKAKQAEASMLQADVAGRRAATDAWSAYYQAYTNMWNASTNQGKLELEREIGASTIALNQARATQANAEARYTNLQSTWYPFTSLASIGYNQARAGQARAETGYIEQQRDKYGAVSDSQIASNYGSLARGVGGLSSGISSIISHAGAAITGAAAARAVSGAASGSRSGKNALNKKDESGGRSSSALTDVGAMYYDPFRSERSRQTDQYNEQGYVIVDRKDRPGSYDMYNSPRVPGYSNFNPWLGVEADKYDLNYDQSHIGGGRYGKRYSY